MAIDKRGGGQTPKWANRENTPGLKIDSGPFIGIIKNNVDPSRQGRLQVWIPDLGGDEQEPSNWYTVRYASPFFGSTIGLPGSPDENSFGIEQQTYGFWAVPPDLNNLVLLTFVMGDPGRGFWFACVPNTPSMAMVPGVSRMPDNIRPIVNKEFSVRTETAGGVYLPVTERNTNTVANDTNPNFAAAPRLVHPFQANIVIEQGLDRDPVRGTITSSSQRDSPSQVIGLSTPGRALPDLAEFPNLEELLKTQALTIETVQSFPSRKGGHSFVMDDGDVRGESRLVRLRSAAGHQIVLHDTANVIYISNSLGTSWVELTPDGSVNIYSGGSVNVRAEQDLNFHADGNVNIHAGDTIQMYAGSTIQSQTKIHLTKADDIFNLNAGVVGLRSGGNMDMQSLNGSWTTAGLTNFYFGSMHVKTTNETVINSNTNSSTGTVSGWNTNSGELWLKGSKVYLNTSGKVPINPDSPITPELNPDLTLYKQTGVKYDDGIKRWFKETGQFESVAPFTPTHEPWARATGLKKYSDGTAEKPKDQTTGTK
jgi:hypothetical protein